MNDFFPEHRAEMIKCLTDYLRNFPGDTAICFEHDDVLQTLLDFTLNGKMIRGRLVKLGFRLFEKQDSCNTVIAGSALELLQSALLIHDDIMDNDTMRRGHSSIYSRYAKIIAGVSAGKAVDFEETGKSLAVCAGDIAFFAGMDLLSSLSVSADILKQLSSLFSREMIYVGLGQMQDVASGIIPGIMSREQILNLYRVKTGRYTFSLPLMTGAILAGADEKAVKQLSEIGEILGIIFQIRDDELGLLSSSDVIGKPVGSDIRQGKITLFVSLFLEAASDEDKDSFYRIFGGETLSSGEIDEVISLFRKYSVIETVREAAETHSEETEMLIRSIENTDPEMIAILSEINSVNLQRAK